MSKEEIQLVRRAAPIVDALAAADVVVLDTETSSLFPWRDGKILAGLGVGPLGGPYFYIPFRHEPDNLRRATPNARLPELQKICEALRGKRVVCHNVKFDFAVIYQEGVDLFDIALDTVDTMWLLRLVSEDEISYELERLAAKYVDRDAMAGKKALKAYMKEAGLATYDQVPAAFICDPYAFNDLRFPSALYARAMPFIEKRGLQELFELEQRLTQRLFYMERDGFRLDVGYTEAELARTSNEQADAEDRANAVAIKAFSKLARSSGFTKKAKELLGVSKGKRAAWLNDQPRSNRAFYVGYECLFKDTKKSTGRVVAEKEFDQHGPYDVKKVFEGLGMSSSKKTPSGASSWDKEALEEVWTPPELEGLGLAAAVTQARAAKKVCDYYRNFLELADADGVLHCSLHQSGAKTGRMSARDPSLLNVPKPPKRGKATGLSQVRGAFVPSEGRMLLMADWAQVEPRIFADYSQEPTMLRAFELGLDMHRLTAMAAFRRDDSDLRDAGKTIGLALLYGLGKKALAGKLNETTAKAKAFMDSYMGRFKGVREFMREVDDECSRMGYGVNLWGRRRYLRPDLSYKLVNFLVQGTAADLMKDATTRVGDALEGYETRAVLPVHDELIFDAVYEELEDVAEIVTREMSRCDRLGVRLQCDLAWSPTNWADKRPLTCDICDGSGVEILLPGLPHAESREAVLKALYRGDEKTMGSMDVKTCGGCGGRGYDLGKVDRPEEEARR